MGSSGDFCKNLHQGLFNFESFGRKLSNTSWHIDLLFRKDYNKNNFLVDAKKSKKLDYERDPTGAGALPRSGGMHSSSHAAQPAEIKVEFKTRKNRVGILFHC